MMEEYMLKKRMKRKIRNDFEEYDEFEKNIVDEPVDRTSSKKLFLLVLLSLLSGFCYFNRRVGGKNPIYLVIKAIYGQLNYFEVHGLAIRRHIGIP